MSFSLLQRFQLVHVFTALLYALKPQQLRSINHRWFFSLKKALFRTKQRLLLDTLVRDPDRYVHQQSLQWKLTSTGRSMDKCWHWTEILMDKWLICSSLIFQDVVNAWDFSPSPYSPPSKAPFTLTIPFSRSSYIGSKLIQNKFLGKQSAGKGNMIFKEKTATAKQPAMLLNAVVPHLTPQTKQDLPNKTKTKRSLSLLKRLISSALSSEPTMHVGLYRFVFACGQTKRLVEWSITKRINFMLVGG